MKARSWVMCSAGVLIGAGTAWGDGFVRMTDGVGGLNGMYSNGGSFVANTDTHAGGPQGFIGLFGGPTQSSNSFNTFCIERNETVTLGSLSNNLNASNRYFARIATAAASGGVSGGSPDPLSSATAVMYSYFRSGQRIGGYLVNGTWTSSGLTASGITSALQAAIWMQEGEITNFNQVFNNSQSQYRTVAQNMLNWAREATDGDGYQDIAGFQNGRLGNVRVLQLWSRDSQTGLYTVSRQDQLTLVPVPAAVWTGGLTLAGLAGLRLRHRRPRP